jgi:hypothetical protein
VIVLNPFSSTFRKGGAKNIQLFPPLKKVEPKYTTLSAFRKSGTKTSIKLFYNSYKNIIKFVYFGSTFFKGGYIYMNQFLFLFLILVVALGIPTILNIRYPMQLLEGFSSYTLSGANGAYPQAQTSVLVQDTYPPIGKNQLSNDTAANIWQDYPTFELGSYAQITNNLRYPDQPDDGTCTPAGMCNALYYKKNIGNNYVMPLPPVATDCGTRVGYFDTDVNLLPYRTKMANILY